MNICVRMSEFVVNSVLNVKEVSPHLTLLLFTADMAENEKQNQLEELMYQRSKLKKKMLGNINFIGELFNLGMLSSKIIISQVRCNMYCFTSYNGEIVTQ